MDELLETMPTISELQLGKFVGGGGNYSYEAAARMAANGTWRGGYIVGMGYITSMYELDEVTVTGSRSYSTLATNAYYFAKNANDRVEITASLFKDVLSRTGISPYNVYVVGSNGRELLGISDFKYFDISTKTIAKYGKNVGKITGFAGGIMTGAEIIYDISNGNTYEAGAKGIINGAKFGLAFIPAIGWVLLLGGLAAVGSTLFFNVGTILLLFLHFDPIQHVEIPKVIRIIISLCFFALIRIYYGYKGRDKRIVEKYDLKIKESNSRFYRLPHIVVIFLYWAISVVCLFIVGWSYNNVK